MTLDPVTVLDAVMPEHARSLCVRLHQAGYQAVAVGGAVRDAILGRVPGDWDVATSATPEQVQRVFSHTIPTGIAHGTVTVLMGREPDWLPIEVTTFRGEGAYSDGRRPDDVSFGVPLREDLARRDLVINAMAYDPVARQLFDPFGGREDLARERIRAVGDPRERFLEDGLRIMRVARFAAMLGFQLDPATEAAIPAAIPALERVSRERVRDELLTLLASDIPSIGLAVARRTGIVDSILPELSTACVDDVAFARCQARIDAARDPLIRLAALLVEQSARLPATRDPAHPLRRLKLKNADIARVARLLCAGLVHATPRDAQLRALLGLFGRAHASDLLALWRADARARPDDSARISSVIERAQTMLDRKDPLQASDLAVSGGDLVTALDLRPGPWVGKLLRALLGRVLDDPSLNTTEQLLTLAHGLHDRNPS